jgi:hypothetical protein
MPMRKNQKILGKIKKFSVMKTRRKPLKKSDDAQDESHMA